MKLLLRSEIKAHIFKKKKMCVIIHKYNVIGYHIVKYQYNRYIYFNEQRGH